MNEKNSDLETFFNAINDFLFILSYEGKLLYVNPIVLKRLNYSKDELLNKNVSIVHLPDQRENVLAIITSILEGKIDYCNIPLMTKDRKLISVETKFSKGKWFGKNVLLGISRDMTERVISEQKLKQSEEKYRLISENANDLISVLDSRLRFEYINETVHKKLMGYTSDDLIGMNGIKLIHPDDRESVIAEVQKLIEKGEGLAVARIRNKNGHYIWTETKGKSFKDKDGNQKLLMITRDITERMLIEQELRLSEEKYGNLFRFSNDAIILHDLDANIIDVNQRVLDLFGYTKSEILFLKVPNLHSSSELEKSKSAFEEISKKGFVNFQIKFKKKNSDVFHADVSSSLFEVGGKKVIQGIVRDISERLKAEKRLKESEEKYRNLYEEAPNAYFSISADKTIKNCNKAAQNLLGYSKEELLDINVFDLYSDSPAGKSKAKMIFQQSLSGKVILDQELQMKKKDGKTVWVSLTVKPIRNRKGQVVESRSMIINITDRKIADQKLKESEKKSQEAFNRAEFYKDLFAHDINNILQSVLSATELSKTPLKKPNSLNEVEDNINHIEDQVARGAKLVSNVRKLSQLEESEQLTQKTEIVTILNTSITFVKNLFRDRDINIQLKIPSKKNYVRANELLQDVFENILINAVRHNNNPTVEINIRVSRIDKNGIKYYKMEFIDNGIGIVDVYKKSIFRREYMKAKSKRGMGLGLSLIKKIIDSYNGKTWVENRVKEDFSKGSNFIILVHEAN